MSATERQERLEDGSVAVDDKSLGHGANAHTWAIYAAVRGERIRAHEKHGDTSMESLPLTDMTRLSVLVEEVGEVAREFNEARHRTHAGLLPQAEREHAIDLASLRKELIQVAAMAAAWADAIAPGPGLGSLHPCLYVDPQGHPCVKGCPHPDDNPIHFCREAS